MTTSNPEADMVGLLEDVSRKQLMKAALLAKALGGGHRRRARGMVQLAKEHGG